MSRVVRFPGNGERRYEDVQIVVADVVGFSLRPVPVQDAIKRLLQRCGDQALLGVAWRYPDYGQAQGGRLMSRIMRSSAGDDLMVGFPFGGYVDVHINFALLLMREAYALRSGDPCVDFEETGWCRCHPYFDLRIGIGDGRAIDGRDVHRHRSFTGNEVNLATRVMGAVGPSQIGLTAKAHEAFVELWGDQRAEGWFQAYRDVPIKHGETIALFQYVDPAETAICSGPIPLRSPQR